MSTPCVISCFIVFAGGLCFVSLAIQVCNSAEPAEVLEHRPERIDYFISCLAPAMLPPSKCLGFFVYVYVCVGVSDCKWDFCVCKDDYTTIISFEISDPVNLAQPTHNSTGNQIKPDCHRSFNTIVFF